MSIMTSPWCRVLYLGTLACPKTFLLQAPPDFNPVDEPKYYLQWLSCSPPPCFLAGSCLGNAEQIPPRGGLNILPGRLKRPGQGRCKLRIEEGVWQGHLKDQGGVSIISHHII